jgi:hypothetical protein
VVDTCQEEEDRQLTAALLDRTTRLSMRRPNATFVDHRTRIPVIAHSQVVESVNAALKGAFADLARGFIRVVGTTKMTVMMGFTLAGFNLDRIRSFRAKHALDDNRQAVERPKKQRARRRAGTWADVVDAIETPPPQ